MGVRIECTGSLNECKSRMRKIVWEFKRKLIGHTRLLAYTGGRIRTDGYVNLLQRWESS